MLRPVVMRHYLKVMEEMGFKFDAVLVGSGIDPQKLNEPGFAIEAEQCYTVIENMIRLTGDRGIGLDVGLKADLTYWGIVGHASMTANTVRDTYDLWCQYGYSLVGTFGKFEIVNENAHTLVLRVVNQPCPPGTFRFIAEELLAMCPHIIRSMSGLGNQADIPVYRELSLAYGPPSYNQRYDDLFNCPVTFNANATSVVIEKFWFDKQLPTNDEEFNMICRQHCADVLFRISHHQQPLRAQLRGQFLKVQNGCLPNLEGMAQLLGMSSRTLRRRLQQEGLTYREVVSEFRVEKACNYLGSKNASPKEVAYALGFKEPCNFYRAFKGWTGQTTGQYRGHKKAVTEELDSDPHSS